MKTGDAVLIEWEEGDGPCFGAPARRIRRIEGTIVLASPNGESLMLGFEAILRGCVGMCPVLLGDDGVYRSVIDGEPVKVSPRP